MRSLCAHAFTALTATALTVGWWSADPSAREADALGAEPGRPALEQLAREHPWSWSLHEVRCEIALLRSSAPGRGAAPAPLAHAWEALAGDWGTTPPFVGPGLAAILGVLGLALAAVLPRSRARSSSALLALLGALLTAPSLLPDDRIREIAGVLEPLPHVMAAQPWLAAGLLAAAACALAATHSRTRTETTGGP